MHLILLRKCIKCILMLYNQAQHSLQSKGSPAPLPLAPSWAPVHPGRYAWAEDLLPSSCSIFATEDHFRRLIHKHSQTLLKSVSLHNTQPY